jgi:hypothetical protein
MGKLSKAQQAAEMRKYQEARRREAEEKQKKQSRFKTAVRPPVFHDPVTIFFGMQREHGVDFFQSLIVFGNDQPFSNAAGTVGRGHYTGIFKPVQTFLQ